MKIEINSEFSKDDYIRILTQVASIEEEHSLQKATFGSAYIKKLWTKLIQVLEDDDTIELKDVWLLHEARGASAGFKFKPNTKLTELHTMNSGKFKELKRTANPGTHLTVNSAYPTSICRDVMNGKVFLGSDKLHQFYFASWKYRFFDLSDVVRRKKYRTVAQEINPFSKNIEPLASDILFVGRVLRNSLFGMHGYLGVTTKEEDFRLIDDYHRLIGGMPRKGLVHYNVDEFIFEEAKDSIRMLSYLHTNGYHGDINFKNKTL